MSDKTWTVVGTSIKRGELRLRLANGSAAAREKVLLKDGHTEVRLFDLPKPMTEMDARAWLEAQGDAVPMRAPKVEPAPRERTVKRLAAELIQQVDAEIAHEALGRELYMRPGNMRVHAWEDCAIELRQEFCRNAARAAGIPTPRGMFPQLERFLEQDGVRVLEDGTLVG